MKASHLPACPYAPHVGSISPYGTHIEIPSVSSDAHGNVDRVRILFDDYWVICSVILEIILAMLRNNYSDDSSA